MLTTTCAYPAHQSRPVLTAMFMDNQTAIVILAHGSRREQANHEVAALAENMKKEGLAGEAEVGHAFLQFGSPTLEESIKNFIQKGCRHIAVAPLFLTTGVHINEDIPELLEKIKKESPETKIVLCPHLGCDNRLLPIIMERAKEGLKKIE